MGERKQIIFTHLDETGSNYEMAYGLIPIEAPYNRKFLVSDKNGKIYSIEIADAKEVLVEVGKIDELTGALFETYGIDNLPPESLLINLSNPGILYWQDSEYELPTIQMGLAALPPNQVVYTENISMIDSTITGIADVTIDSDAGTLFAVSFDKGEKWYVYVNNACSLLAEEHSGMTKTAVEGIGADAWAQMATTGHYMFRFILAEGGYVNNITIHYLN